MKNFKLAVGATLVAASFTMAMGAQAATTADAIYPGTTNSNPGGLDDQGYATFGGASNVVPWMSSAYSATDAGTTLSGTLYSTVITGDSNNPFGMGGYDFVYQLVLNTAPANNTIIELFTTKGWNNLTSTYDPDGLGPLGLTTTAVGYVRIPTTGAFTGGEAGITPAVLLGAAPIPAAGNGPRPPASSTRSGGGDTISFAWGSAVGQVFDGGRRSPFLIVYTGAHSIGTATEFIQDGVNASGRAYAPSAVPEPETYAMMLAGLGLMGFAARRRKQTS